MKSDDFLGGNHILAKSPKDLKQNEHMIIDHGQNETFDKRLIQIARNPGQEDS